MIPNFKELAERGKLIMIDLREAEAAEHIRRSAALTAAQVTRASTPPRPAAHVVAARPAPPTPAARLESFRVFDRDGRTIGEVKVIGNRFIAHDVTGRAVAECRDAHAALAAVEQGAIDASWREAIKSVDAEQSTRSNSGAGATSADDPGWREIVGGDAREQPAQRSSGRRQEDDANFGWTEIIRAMNAKVGASA